MPAETGSRLPNRPRKPPFGAIYSASMRSLLFAVIVGAVVASALPAAPAAETGPLALVPLDLGTADMADHVAVVRSSDGDEVRFVLSDRVVGDGLLAALDLAPGRYELVALLPAYAGANPLPLRLPFVLRSGELRVLPVVVSLSRRGGVDTVAVRSISEAQASRYLNAARRDARGRDVRFGSIGG